VNYGGKGEGNRKWPDRKLVGHPNHPFLSDQMAIWIKSRSTPGTGHRQVNGISMEFGGYRMRCFISLSWAACGWFL
jgi:hypothetical protein